MPVAPTDAFAEFHNENSNRAYPIQDGRVASAGDFFLSDGVLLDLRGASRTPFSDVHLIAYTGPTSGQSGIFAGLAGHRRFFFGVNRAPNIFLVKLDVPVGSGYGYSSISGQVEDLDYPGYPLIKLTGTFGPAVEELDLNEFYDFDTTAPIEPALILNLADTQVNLLGVIRRNEADFLLEGDVKIRGGRNTLVRQSGDSIEVVPQSNGGLLGAAVAEDPEYPGASCGNWISSISGVTPPGQRFFLTRGPGITIENLPDEHKIIVSVDLGTLPAAVTCVT